MIIYETHIGWIRSNDILRAKHTIYKNNRSIGFKDKGTTLRVTR